MRAVCKELNEQIILTVSVIHHCVPNIKEPILPTYQVCRHSGAADADGSGKKSLK